MHGFANKNGTYVFIQYCREALCAVLRLYTRQSQDSVPAVTNLNHSSSSDPAATLAQKLGK